jgi:hypothetical protein
MTSEQVVKVAKKYLQRLLDGGWECKRADTASEYIAVRSDEVDHVAWMLNEIVSGAVTDSKAERWLCFSQGVLWCHSFYSIDQMREDNRE